MPGQSGDPISAALQVSLSQEIGRRDPTDITSLLTYSAKQVLLREIEYEPYHYDSTSFLEALKSKYIVINENNCEDEDQDSSQNHSAKSNNSEKLQVPSGKTNSDKVLINNNRTMTDGVNGSDKSSGLGRPDSKANYPKLPSPGKVLWPEDAITVGWQGHSPVGSGFVNVGNSCYFNSTLQALFHIPSFVNWLLMENSHNCSRPTSSFTDISTECLICACAMTLKSSQENSGKAIKPYLIYSKLKSICKQLNPGYQEDAHEFLRHLVDSLDRTYLIPFKGMKLDHLSKETTPLSRIFGGYLRNEVVCQSCHHVSTTFQYFQDMPLDIRSANHIDTALEGFFGRETLTEHEGYVCEACKARVACTKKFSLEKAPRVLCVQLKRFGATSGKNNKAVGISPRLNLSRFRARGVRPDGFEPYELTAVVNHIGTSTACGHYTAVARAADGAFYLFDDHRVDNLHDVTQYSSHSYILLYEQQKRKTEPVNGIKPEVAAKTNNFKVNNLLQTCAHTVKSVKDKCFGKGEGLKGVFKVVTAVAINLDKPSTSLKPVPKPVLAPSTSGKPEKPSLPCTSDTSPGKLQESQKLSEAPKVPAPKLSPPKTQMNGTHLSQNSDAKKLVPYNESSSCESDSSVSTGGISACCSPEPEGTKDQKVTTKPESNGFTPKEHQNGGSGKVNGNCWVEKGWKVTNHNDKSPKHYQNNKSNHLNNKNNWKINNNNNDFRNKMNSMGHRGYGKPVFSWSGKVSDMESEVARENFLDKHRVMYDDFDSQQPNSNKRLMYDDYDCPQSKKKMKYNGGGGHHFNPNNKRKFEDAQKQRWFNKKRDWNYGRDFNRSRHPQPWYNHHS